jgi:hypothetical protein
MKQSAISPDYPFKVPVYYIRSTFLHAQPCQLYWRYIAHYIICYQAIAGYNIPFFRLKIGRLKATVHRAEQVLDLIEYIQIQPDPDPT